MLALCFALLQFLFAARFVLLSIGARSALSFAAASSDLHPPSSVLVWLHCEFEFCSSALSCQLHVSATFRFRLPSLVVVVCLFLLLLLLMESGQRKAVKSTTNQVGCCLFGQKDFTCNFTHTKWQTSCSATCLPLQPVSASLSISGVYVSRGSYTSPLLTKMFSLLNWVTWICNFSNCSTNEKSTTSQHR